MDLRYLFHPKRIAVIGASRNRKKVGRIIFENLLKSDKEIVPINPNAKEICGIKAYPTILEFPKKIDLCVIAVRNILVPRVLKECGEKGVKACIIISAGFSEIGRKDLEEEIIKISREYEMAVLGPNCLGLINSKERINATFMDVHLKWENYAIISQSGALGAGILDYLKDLGIGIGYFISVGNQAVLSVGDFLDYLSNEEDLESIGIYIESVKNGRKFFNSLRNSEKNIFVLKSGRTSAGIRAAISHTGALVTEDKIYSFVIKQAGKVRVDSLEEFLGSLILSSRDRIPGKRIVIITNSGGPAVLLSDYLEENGFEIVRLPEDLVRRLNEVLPKEWSHGNPIDLLGDADSKRYREVLNILEDYGKIFDLVIFCLTPLSMTDVENISKEIIRFRRNIGKPVITNFIGGNRIKEGIKILRDGGIQNFFDGRLLARVLKHVYNT